MRGGPRSLRPTSHVAIQAFEASGLVCAAAIVNRQVPHTRYADPSSWGDRKRWSLEDRLGQVLLELETLAEEEEQRRLARRGERERALEAAMAVAQKRAIERHRVEVPTQARSRLGGGRADSCVRRRRREASRRRGRCGPSGRKLADVCPRARRSTARCAACAPRSGAQEGGPRAVSGRLESLRPAHGSLVTHGLAALAKCPQARGVATDAHMRVLVVRLLWKRLEARELRGPSLLAQTSRQGVHVALPLSNLSAVS